MIEPCIRPLGLAFLMAATPALASGFTPVPETSRSFADQAACRQHLIDMRRIHEKIVTPGRAMPEKIGGITLVREVKTRGVTDEADGASRYDFELWTHASGWDEAAQRQRITHSYERRSQTCRGGVMIVSGANGFTQPTFADKPLTRP
jgi:hypothetical protein